MSRNGQSSIYEECRSRFSEGSLDRFYRLNNPDAVFIALADPDFLAARRFFQEPALKTAARIHLIF